MDFNLNAPFKPTGDQPQAIDRLIAGIKSGMDHQVLLGVTGSGKTFTMANCIARINRPTLVISHNKTLAAQLYQEFRDFFPDNAVSYFVSYYDYYQPEAYIPQTDTYIEKETDINMEIDKLRLAATTNLLTRKDTIIIASVSCIYNIGSPKEYGNFILDLRTGINISMKSIFSRLTELQYERESYDFHRGTFRVRGDVVDIFPAYEDKSIRITHDGEKITLLTRIDPVDGSFIESFERYILYPAKHYMTNPRSLPDVFSQIKKDLNERVLLFKKRGKILEAERLRKRVLFDIEMIQEVGYINGIENYSRYFDNRKPGDPPFTLLDYFNEPYDNDWLVFVDESHMTIPQIRGMYHGDRKRKENLVDFGFRLPAALDNRPLTFAEFMRRVPKVIYVSATPSQWEISMAMQEAKRNRQLKIKSHRIGKKKITMLQNGVVEQLIRPTGLVDPSIVIRPTKGQIKDLTREILQRKENRERVLITTLTKRMAEDLATYLQDADTITKFIDKKKPVLSDKLKELPKVHYLHSDMATLERSDILDDLRQGVYDVIVGINLLREGLDLPEVSLVAILDADKEGFLRSETSLIQTMGRAARHVSGQIIMYADVVTGSMKRAIKEVKRRRKIQIEYNKTHGIMPQSIRKGIRAKLVREDAFGKERAWQGKDFLLKDQINELLPDERKRMIKRLKQKMHKAAKDMDFEFAAELRDQIKAIQSV